MSLHTADLVDPTARLFLSRMLSIVWRGRALWQRIIRVVTVNERIRALSDDREDATSTPRYAAGVLLNPEDWTDEVWEVHRLVTNPADGRLVGDTFTRKGFVVRQNRLLLGWWGSFLMPRSLRRLVPRNGLFRWLWRVEVYTLYVTKPGGSTILYGTFVEYVPFSWGHKPRSQLGAERVWQEAGLQKEFTAYLLGKVPARIAVEHQEVLRRARRLGLAAAILAPVTFPVLAKFAQKRRTAGIFRSGWRA